MPLDLSKLSKGLTQTTFYAANVGLARSQLPKLTSQRATLLAQIPKGLGPRKLCLAQLSKLVLPVLRQLLRLTKAPQTQLSRCPCLLLQDVPSKLRVLDALA